MAKKRSNRKNIHKRPPQIEVDNYARILQLVGLLGVIFLIAIDNLVKDTNIEPWVIFGILGIAVGLSPEQILGLIRDLIKSFLGRR